MAPANPQILWLFFTSPILSAGGATSCGHLRLISGRVISPLRRVIAAGSLSAWWPEHCVPLPPSRLRRARRSPLLWRAIQPLLGELVDIPRGQWRRFWLAWHAAKIRGQGKRRHTGPALPRATVVP